jgi:hypothetical protein
VGARIVTNNSLRVLTVLRGRSIALLDAAGDAIEEVADSLVAEDTGALRRSRKREGRGTARQVVRYGDGDQGGKVDYATIIETGSPGGKYPPRPFLRPGAEAAIEILRRGGRR